MNRDVVNNIHVWEIMLYVLAIGHVSRRPELTNHVYAAIARLSVSHAFGFLSVSRAKCTIRRGR